jgi:O-antigen/teichoic acid export membrane protein
MPGNDSRGDSEYFRFAKNFLIYLPTLLLPALTGIITIPIYTRLFRPADYGQYALAIGVIELLFATTCTGFGSGVLRFYPIYSAKNKTGDFFSTLISFFGPLVLTIGAISFAAVFLLGKPIFATLYPLLLISILIFVLRSAFDLFLAVARAQEKSSLYTKFSLLRRYSSLGLGLLLVIAFGLGVEGLLWGELFVLFLLISFLSLSITRRVIIRLRNFCISTALELWRFAWPLNLGALSLWALHWADRYVIAWSRPVSEVGSYSMAYNLSVKSIDILVTIFIFTMAPQIFNTLEKNGEQAAAGALNMVTRLYLLFCVPCAVGLSLLASPLFALLTTQSYYEGYRVVGYIAFSSLFWGLAQICARGLLISNNTLRFALNQFLAALVNLGLNLLFVPRFGFVAAGITTLIGFLVLLTLHYYSSRPYLSWKFPWKTLWNVVTGCFFMGLSCLGFYNLSGNSSAAHPGYLFMSIILAVLVYFAALWVMGEATEEDRTIAKQIWHRMTQKSV